MKGNNFSKKFNGQIQTMGKGGIKGVSNTNPVNMNYNNQQYNPTPMNRYPQNQYNNPMMNNNNNYQKPNYNLMNAKSQNQNIYNNQKNRNNYYENNNNPMVRNAKMILDNNIQIKQKARSAKKPSDINKSNEMGYQGGKGVYNMNNNYNMGMNNMMYNNQRMYNPPPVYNNNYNQYNQYNSQNNNMNMKMKMNNHPKSPKGNMNKVVKKTKVSDYQLMEFHPYTLRDYKELIRNKVVMGPLGANIGTKEWETKRNKMKKMLNYSNNINKEHKGIVSLKKDSPKEEIEKLTKEKYEKSTRHRQYEYSKLVRAGKYKDENENFGKNLEDNLGGVPENGDDLYLRKYEDQLRQETDNINNPKPKEPAPVVEEKQVEENPLDINQLLKQKEAYKAKIQGIRDTLLD